jgi:hypothetical protein
MGSDPDLQPVCIQALMDMGANTAAPQVAPLCGSQSADVRYLAVQFLQKFDCSDQASEVAKLHDDPHLKVRTVAREAIAGWRDQRAGTVRARDSAARSAAHAARPGGG